MSALYVIAAGIIAPLLSQLLNQKWLTTRKNYVITAIIGLVLAVLAALAGHQSLSQESFVRSYLEILGMGQAIERLCLQGTRLSKKLLDSCDLRKTKKAKQALDCHGYPVEMATPEAE